MPIYDPADHPLLSPSAKALSPPALIAQADAAEALLRRGPTALADTSFEVGSAEYARAVLAVVYQVNYQLAAGVDAEIASSITRGDRSTTYRNRLVSPRAQALVSALVPITSDATGWPIVGSLR